MQMIDVLKRLAELDAVNPNVDTGLKVVQPVQNVSATVSESVQVDECGMMPEMGGMDRPSTPASINMTAGSGEELGDLIRAIATLAGTASNQSAGDMAVQVPPAEVTVGDRDDMRSVLDRLNDTDVEDDEDDEEEEEVKEYDNTPSDPTDTNEFDAEQHAYHPNQPGAAKGRATTNNPRGVPGASPTMEEIEQQLFAEYQNFIKED